MAGFGGRKGPNVSQYVSNLNAIPSEHDLAIQQSEDFDFSSDLAAFTNTEFLDFDQGEHAFPSSIDYNANEAALTDPAAVQDNNSFPYQPFEPFLNHDSSISIPNFPPQPDLASPTSFDASPTVGTKRPADVTSPLSHISQEDTSRFAAEEDKRRRNTAASARFRVKKKQREAALEAKAKEMTDKTSTLEQRIGQLQTENEWLRNLVTEKKGKEYLAEEWKAFKRRAGSESDSGDDAANRSTDQIKKGVGTA
ncbi:MAG: hypothetical protein Q9220_004066 [cf. Caloplaca sp. 1 TL-2023]